LAGPAASLVQLLQVMSAPVPKGSYILPFACGSQPN